MYIISRLVLGVAADTRQTHMAAAATAVAIVAVVCDCVCHPHLPRGRRGAGTMLFDYYVQAHGH